MKIDPQLGTIVWDNGADIDPDVLIKGMNANIITDRTTSKPRRTLKGVVKEKGARYKIRNKLRKKS